MCSYLIISADNKDRLCYRPLPSEPGVANLSGMGTKVQYKNYLPGYYSTRDLNEDATHNWSLLYEDAVANGQFCVNYDTRLANGYMDYDKEALKQTMLNHETIFRKQVHELHRLYIKQRELMEELKQKEQFRYALQPQPSLPSSSSLHTFTKSNINMQPMPHLWEVNCKNNGLSVSGREILEPLKVVNNESRQASAIITESGDSVKKSDFDAKLSNRPQVMVDLQLPAYAYIEIEEDKMDGGHDALAFFQVGGSPDLSRDFESGKDLKLTLGSGRISSRGESWQSSSRLQDAQSSRDISNLNDTILINGTNHGALSSSSRCWQGKAPYEKTSAPKSSLPLSSTSLNMKNLQEHKAALSPLLRQKSFANESAFAGKSSTGVFKPVFSVHNMLDSHRLQQSCFEKPSELSSFLLSRHTKMEAEFKEKIVGSNVLFRTCLGSANHSASSAPFSRIPIAGGLSVPSSSNSFQVKPTQGGTPFAPIGVDGLPLLNKSIPINLGSTSGMSIFASGCASNKFLFGRSLTSNGSFSSEVSPYPNIFLHDLNHLSCLNMPRPNTNKASLNHGQASNNCGASSVQDDSSVHGPRESVARSGNKDMNTLKTVDLNLDLSADCHDESPSLLETVARDHSIKNLNLSGGFSWFKLSPTSKQPQSKLDIITSPVNVTTQDFGNTEPRKIISSDAACSVMKNSKPLCPTSKAIHGGDAIHQCGQCLPDLPHKTYIIDLEKPAPSESYLEDDAEDNVCRQVDQINLNIMPCDTPNFGYQIDVEAIPDIDDDALCCKETLEPDQLFVSAEAIKCGIGAKEDTERPQQGATRAADIIVAMSADICRNLDTTGSFLLNASSAETLVWFANVVCSNASNLRNIYGTSEDSDAKKDFDSDGIDFFESMTLKLKETKPEDHWVDQPTQKDRDDDEASFASLLVGKPKRGQARKRRQKRDFQKDILPGLACLSRQEATEDLQTIGGLMRASGQSWEICISRRNGGRNGTSRPRGGRRARGGSSAATKIRASPTPALTPNNTELAIGGTNMVGWGRTRRCRRARFPSGTVVPLLQRE